MINVFSPSLGQSELLAIADSFNTGWVGKGPKVAEFEAAWAQHIGVNPENVVSVNCATEGLFAIVQLLDIGPGDEVIIPSIHFIGAAQAVLATGAKPVFCDVDKRTLNATIQTIFPKLTKKVKAIILNHYGGVSCDIEPICKFLNDGDWTKYIKIIEDAACSPATVYKGKAAGTWGHFGVWSFDAMKIMSTGDGGMIYCENPAHVNELRRRLYLGMTQESGLSSQGERWWEFEVSGMGRRAIMNDLAAGMGLEQLKRLDGFCLRREQITRLYCDKLSGVGDLSYVRWHNYSNPYKINSRGGSSCYFYWIQTPRRDELAKFLRSQEIYCTFRYYPLHRVFKTGDNLPGAEYAADNTLLLPLHCNLTDEQIGYVCEKVKEFYER